MRSYLDILTELKETVEDDKIPTGHKIRIIDGKAQIVGD